MSNTIVTLQLELIKMIGEGKFSNENSTSPLFPGWTKVRILVFAEGGKLEDLGKNFWSKVDNRKQTQPTWVRRLRSRTQATRVGVQRSH